MIRKAYLDAAASAIALLDDPVVAAAWSRPSALPEFQVSGLAGHLGRQVTQARGVLTQEHRAGQPVTLLGHYADSQWVGAEPDEPTNVRIRRDGEQTAAGGAGDLVAQARTALDRLRELLPVEPADRVVYLPWAGWSLTLDDFLVTRILEIVVHCDDLAVSVGIETPAMPAPAFDTALDLLARLAVRRHGQAAVLRALSRAERAPATIAAL